MLTVLYDWRNKDPDSISNNLKLEKKVICIVGKKGTGKTMLYRHILSKTKLLAGLCDDELIDASKFVKHIKNGSAMIFATQIFDDLPEYVKCSVDIIIQMK